MDLLSIIKEQILQIDSPKILIGIKSVLSHIERAEFFWSEGRKKIDEAYFTDTIYRTNQAFEGILKEAYKILANKTDDDLKKLRPYDVEEYLTTEKIFNDRVLELFKNYRQNWRNVSTHDYKLFFNESEALLALVSVSAFIHVLLNQMNEKLYFDKENVTLKSNLPELLKDYKKIYDLDSVDKIVNLLINFSKSNLRNSTDKMREIEAIGMINAYLSSIDNSIEIYREPIFDKGLRPDFLLNLNNQKVVIEVKMLYNRFNERDEHQVLTYLEASKIKTGILFYFSPSKTNEIMKEIKKISFNDNEYTFIKIYPKLIDNK